MGNIIVFNPAAQQPSNQVIDCQKVEAQRTRRQLDPGMVQPARTTTGFEATQDHAADPIKSVDDIMRLSNYLISQKRYRDNMLFIVGINFGLRVSDLLRLRFNMVLDNTLAFRESFPILEKKTSNTRKTKKNRYITINDAAIDAITLYLKSMSDQGKSVHLDDYMFRSESNNGKYENKPMTRAAVDVMLKKAAGEVGILAKISTHTLRKTFGYHQMVMGNNDPRRLLLLQKMFGHSTAAQTLDYIGITTEEIEDAYLNLNLGSREYYGRMGTMVETAV